MNAEEKAWRVISGAPGIGPKTLWAIADYLMEHQKAASWLLQHPDAMEAALRGRSTRVDSSKLNTIEPEGIGDDRVTILHPLHPNFPLRIRMFKDTVAIPALLYSRGNTTLSNKPGVAIVGARNACDRALEAAEALASELGRNGINIVSGYAKGIDTAAHLGALRDGGTTSIVLSEGINNFRSKRELKEFFTKDNTLVLSQFEPNARWAAHFAMTRNKLVCALSQAVVVIVSGPEKDVKGRMSGTFDAGATAMKMGIPVFTVTPSFFDNLPTGNQQLISKGGREWSPSEGAGPILKAISEAPPSVAVKPGAKKRIVKSKQLGFAIGETQQ